MTRPALCIVARSDDTTELNSICGMNIDARIPSRRITILLGPDLCEIRSVVTPPLTVGNAQRFMAANSGRLFLREAFTAYSFTSIGWGGSRWLVCGTSSELLDELRHSTESQKKKCSIRPLLAVAAAKYGSKRKGKYSRWIEWEARYYRLDFLEGNWIDAVEHHKNENITYDLITIDDLQVAANRNRTLDFNRTRMVNAGLKATAFVLVALLAINLLLNYASLSRQVAHVRGTRRSIQLAVNEASRERQSMVLAASRLQALERMQGPARSVLGSIAALASALPAATVITRLQLRGDTIIIDGTSASATALYERLQATKVMEKIKVNSPPKRIQLKEGFLEAFSMSGVIPR